MSGHYQPADDDANQPLTPTVPRADLDLLLRAVTHPHRRHTLHYLASTTDPQSVADITATVIDGTDQQSHADRQRLAVELTHQHLPLLDDAGLIKWTGSDLVASTERTADAVAVLAIISGYFD